MTAIHLGMINMQCNEETALNIGQPYINRFPPWQREYEAWDEAIKTRLIESIILHRAMNPIWTILNPKNGQEDVLDGMHRLTTALDFLNDKFKINPKHFAELNTEDYYNKYYFKDFDEEEKAKIRNYKFIFNQLDSSYNTDANKRKTMYEILNRSSRQLNEYEFNKVIYKQFYDIITPFKPGYTNLKFLKPADIRGAIDTEIINLFVLAEYLPNSWVSINNIRDIFYKTHIGETEEEVNRYVNDNYHKIKNNLEMGKKL